MDAIEIVSWALMHLPERVLPHGEWVSSLALLKDGRVASAGTEINIWDPDSNAGALTLNGNNFGSRVTCLAVLRDGRLVTGGDAGIQFWTVGTSNQPPVLLDSAPVTSLTILEDGRLVSGGLDGDVEGLAAESLRPTYRAGSWCGSTDPRGPGRRTSSERWQ